MSFGKLILKINQKSLSFQTINSLIMNSIKQYLDLSSPSFQNRYVTRIRNNNNDSGTKDNFRIVHSPLIYLNNIYHPNCKMKEVHARSHYRHVFSYPQRLFRMI